MQTSPRKLVLAVVLAIITSSIIFASFFLGKGKEGEEVAEIPVTRISYSEGLDGFPTLFQWPNDCIWVVWKSKPPQGADLHYVISLDNGKTWKSDEPRMLTQTDPKTNTEHPSLAMMGNVAILVWDDGHEVLCMISSDQGESWERNDLNLGPGWYPTLYKMRDGTLWLMWISTENGRGGTIKYVTSQNGKDWGSEKEILSNPDISGKENAIYGNPTIYQDDEQILVAFDTGAESKITSDIFWMTSSDNGKTWSEVKILTENTPTLDDVDPCFFETPQGELVLVYASKSDDPSSEYVDYDIYYRLYTGDGWSDASRFPSPISERGVRDWYPYCFLANDGQIWLTWASDRVDVANDEREVFVAPLEEFLK